MKVNLFFRREKLVSAIKWITYSLLLLLAYTLQTIPGMLEFFGAKPVWILPVALSVCMFEGVMGSAVLCTVTGLLWDISSDKLFGFNAVILIIMGTIIALLCIYYLRTKLINAVFFVAVTAVLQGLLDYLFYYSLWGYDNPIIILTSHILPTAVYTVLVSPLVFFLVKKIALKFNEAART